MTSPNSIPEATQWQGQYSASQSQWQDMKRSGEFTLPIAFWLVIATLYTIAYIANQFDTWLFATTSQFLFYILLLRIFLIFLTPIILVLLCSGFILKQAGELILQIYPPITDVKVSTLLRNRLLGVMPFPPPLSSLVKYSAIVIDKLELEESHWARWLGGPAVLVIHDGFAVYLERGNKFSRVVGPSSPPPFLERYERIKDIIDLRPQTKSGYVQPWTKDGIKIKLLLNVEVRIDASPEILGKSSNFRYPFDPIAVKAAAEYTSVRLIDEKPQEQNWLEGAWRSVTGAINAFVAGHSLDELFIAPQAENHANPNHLNHETPENIEQIFSKRISEKVLNDVREKLHNHGIHILNIQLTQLEAPPAVLELRIGYWETARLKISAYRNSRAEADRIRARELAHAEAQRTMLTTIMNKLENVESNDLTESLILSLSGILDQNLDDPIIRPLIAKESFAVLDRVKKLLKDRF